MPKAAESADQDYAKKMTQAYTTATSRLRAENKDRFNELRVEESTKLGIEWSPQPTAEDRARQQMQAILSEFPQLKEELVVIAASGGEVPVQ